MDTQRPTIPFDQAVVVWARVAAYSFGGPAGQIAVMHRILVEEKRWISESRFLHALNYCMLLPGPEAQQLATYIGWLLHGTRGGLVAGGLFVLPGFVSILVLSMLYAAFQQAGPVEALFFGLKAAVLAVVVEAVLRIGGRVLKNRVMLAVAALSFVGIFFFELPFPLIVLLAGLLGLVGQRMAPDFFLVIRGREVKGGDAALDVWLDRQAVERPSTARTLTTGATWLAIWLVPLIALAGTLGTDHTFTKVGTFFSTAAMVTFGGAYSVLAYIAHQAVEHHGWLQPGEMLDGLGLAETTPGPLVQVVQFVGFLATYRDPGAMHPMVAGTLGAILTTWVTFAPCFLWIFTGAPYIEWLRGNRHLTTALSTITAAVVGVVLNLAVWSSLHVIFASVAEIHGPLGLRLLVPDPATLDPGALLIALGSLVAMLRFHAPMIPTLLSAAEIGLIWRLLLG